MSEKEFAHAPYNFIPFSNRIITYEKKQPNHNKICTELKTGEIKVTITAETPIFISNGDKDNNIFICNKKGNYIIPASSLRGLIRTNMQILGFGAITPNEDFKDYQIYFREMATKKANLQSNLMNYYENTLNTRRKKSKSGKSYTIPENIKSGYLFKRGDKYYISPTKTNYLRVSRKHKDVLGFGDEPARVIDIFYQVEDNVVKSISTNKKPNFQKGKLLYTGKPVSKPNSLYIFPEKESSDEIEISKKDILSYEEDWENRKNVLGDKKDFWALPNKDGEEKPVFYLELDTHKYFGMSLFLRIGYKYPLSKGIPVKHIEFKNNFEENLKLKISDLPHSILGYSTNEKSYRSRISVSDFEAKNNVRELNPVNLILAGPKASYYAGYVVDGKNYNDEDFKLRGYKQYWLKDIEKTEIGTNKRVGTTIRPLPKGTIFKGVIKYKNLYPEELGLLLWSLKLEDNCFHNIGMGKPYGYGRIKINIDDLKEYDFEKLYNLKSISADVYSENKNNISEYIKKYDEYAGELLNTKNKDGCYSIKECLEIKNFFYMKSKICDKNEFSYMKLGEFKTPKPLQTVSEIMEMEERKVDEDLLSSKFGSRFKKNNIKKG